MKATGIVRKIDELGRIVIPKEIRKTLRIKEGDPLEIFTNKNGELIFKKYSPLNELETISISCAKTLNLMTGHIAVVCDKDSVLYSQGLGRDNHSGTALSQKICEIIDKGEVVMLSTLDSEELIPVKIDDSTFDYVAEIIYPVVEGGAIIGAIVLASQKPGTIFGENELEKCKVVANVLGNYV